jgi:hypothetical protein
MGRIIDHDGLTTYRPIIGAEGQVGYRCTHHDGRVRHIYLSPSTGCAGPKEGYTAAVFVYGDEGPDEFANALHFYETWED